MPFQSEKQRRYLWANEPEIARDWTDTYGSRIKKDSGGIMRVGLRRGTSGAPGGGDPGMHSTKASDRGPRDDPDRHGPVSKPVHHPGPDRTITPTHVKPGRKPETVRDQKPTFIDKIRRDTLRRNKVEALRNMSLMGKALPGIWGKTISALKDPVPGWAEDLTEEELSALASEVQKFKDAGGPINQATYNPNLNPTKKGSGRELLGRVFEGQTLVDKGLFTQAEHDRLFPGPLGPPDRGQDFLYPRDVHPGTGGSTTPSTGPTTISEFQESLKDTGDANTPGYYVGEKPAASNVAWGKAYGVDPRTMGMTSFAAHGGRIPAAFGGIMDSSTGRRAYGLGSIFKKIGRAAKKVFKSPIGKAALIGAGIFGLPAMGSFPGFPGLKGMMPTGLKNKLFMKQLTEKSVKDGVTTPATYKGLDWGKLGIMGATALPFVLGGGDKEKDDKKFDYDAAKNAYRDEIMRIKSGVSAGSLNPDQWSYLPSDYTYTGAKDGGRIGMYAGGQSTPSDYTMEDAMMTTTQDKLGGITDVMKQADLSRQGSVGQFYAADGGSPNHAKLMARVQELQDEGLDFNSAMAQAMKELSSGNAQGGRIGYQGGGETGHPPVTMGQPIQAPQMPPPVQTPQRPNPMPAPQPNRMAAMNPMMNSPMMGGRRMAQEGGLMDLGGMEKDYRNDGGFVPLGGKEKADDVPARLSKNEFVFTADAVRGAGDGDIDKGAEIMENIMKNLEQGGQISEETQGLSGAQGMFDVSERLSEVV